MATRRPPSDHLPFLWPLREASRTWSIVVSSRVAVCEHPRWSPSVHLSSGTSPAPPSRRTSCASTSPPQERLSPDPDSTASLGARSCSTPARARRGDLLGLAVGGELGRGVADASEDIAICRWLQWAPIARRRSLIRRAATLARGSLPLRARLAHAPIGIKAAFYSSKLQLSGSRAGEVLANQK